MGDRRGRQVGPQGSAIRVLTALRGWPSRHGKGLGLPGISALTAAGGAAAPAWALVAGCRLRQGCVHVLNPPPGSRLGGRFPRSGLCGQSGG